MNIGQCLVSLKSNIENIIWEQKKNKTLTLLSKANSCRKAVKEKQGILETLTQATKKLQKELWTDTVDVFMLWKLFNECIRFLINEWINNLNFVITAAFSFATELDNIEKFLLFQISNSFIYNWEILDSWQRKQKTSID